MGATPVQINALSLDLWAQFYAHAQIASDRLIAEVTRAADAVRSLMQHTAQQQLAVAQEHLDPGQVSSVERLFGDLQKRLFAAPLGAFEELRPVDKTLSAMEQHRLEMTDLARRLPLAATVAEADLVERMGQQARRGWRRIARMRSSVRSLSIREAVLANLHAQMADRLRLDREFELVLMQAELHLLAGWQAFCRHQLARLAGEEPDPAAFAKTNQWWAREAEALLRRCDHAVGGLQKWSATSPMLLRQAVLRRARLSGRRQRKIQALCQDNLGRWQRRQRSVSALVEMERQLSEVSREAAAVTRHALQSLHAEHSEILQEMAHDVAWFRARADPASGAAFPPPTARLLSAEQRARDWLERICAKTDAAVPVSIETARIRWTITGRVERWRPLYPRQVLLDAMQNVGLDAAQAAFQEAQAEHTAVVRDIERARQVVIFGLQAKQAEAGPELLDEAVANATALLEHRRQILTDVQPSVEAGLSRAMARSLLRAHTTLEVGRFGQWSLITRQGAPRTGQQLRNAALRAVQTAALASRALVQNGSHSAARALGWERPVAPPREPLQERARLSTTLQVHFRPRELPALYERLFSLAPLDDPRFLVGREVELNGLARALSLWKAGSSVTVLVVGARGSGKTSLLNCAASSLFTDVPVLRGEFSDRISDPARMAQFLRDLFGLAPEADLVAGLNQQKRVVVLEEFERTFLRGMNGFEAQRHLLRLIRATSRSIFWVLSLNRAAFRYLDAVESLERHFSHRIHAMSVSPPQIRDAILQRHTLSGLRLQFAPLPPRDPRVSRMRRFLGLERSPQEMFFDLLYQQSEGLFRSAIERWLDSIDRIEGAVVHLAQPVDPNFTQLEAELALDDRFVLQAILQHASLSPGELAAVLDLGLCEAESRLDRLLALEILEPEPSRPGLRVRPQAGRFVRDTLARNNLL